MKTAISPAVRTAAGILLAGSLSGCAQQTDWFPMKVGRHWTYQVRAGFDRRVESVRVVRPLAIASVDGFELGGPLGVSRLAWKNGDLVAESTVNATFSPPLPLLIPGADMTRDLPRRIATWHGRVVTLGKEHPGSAVLTEQTDKIDVGTRKVNAILATVSIRIPNGKIELQSWYEQGIGIVQQEQRTNGARIVQLQLLDHGDN